MAKKASKSPFDRLIDAVQDGDAEAINRAAEELTDEQKSLPVNVDSVVKAMKSAQEAGDHLLVGSLSENYATRLRSDAVSYPKTFLRELSQAVDTFDREKAAQLCQQLISFHRSASDAYPLSAQNEVLYTLQRKRYFDLIIQVGDTLIMRNGPIDERDERETQVGKLKVKRRYGQALIDSGQLAAALAFLEFLAIESEKHKVVSELAQARGLIGRAHKQFYMDAAAQGENGIPMARYRDVLSEAVDAYGGVYKNDESKVWHGINTTALVKRAVRDKIKLATKWTASKAAKDILKQITGKAKFANLWDLATAAEACLALGKYSEALKWIRQYIDSGEADAFEYASTLRQFEEVWQLDETKKNQAQILQLLRSSLLKKEGGEIRIRNLAQEVETAQQLSADTQYEKVLGQDRYKTYRWYVMGLDRATAVAKVRDPVGNGVGTGFLVKGTDIHPSITEDWVFVTNAHVISDDPQEQSGLPRALSPEDAAIEFHAGPDAGKRFSVGQLIFTSRRTLLDCTIVSLAERLSFDKPFRISKSLPKVGTEKGHRVYVIGHPKGAGLSFSLHDNLLLDHEAPKVHYRSPTEGGSSGSPVFNANWDLVALHHLGGDSIQKLNNKSGSYGANEGIFIQTILQAVARDFG